MVTNKMIRTEEDHQAALDRIDEIFDAPTGSTEGDELDLLVHLVEVYEAERYPIPPPDPIAAIEFRMEQQDLTQRDLIPFIGSRSKVSEVLSGKKQITMRMARALHQHLGIPAEVLLQETGASFDDSLESTAFGRFPLAEMARRGWIEKLTPYKDYAEELVRSLIDQAGDEHPTLQPLYRQNAHRRENANTDWYALRAWRWRVMALANENTSPVTYQPGSVTRQFMAEVAKLSPKKDGPRLAQEFLAEHGISLVVERHLSKTHLDGATLWLDGGRPVVGMTLRYDRLDNFWFTLMHELAHIARHEHTEDNEFFDDMTLRGAKQVAEDTVEAEADELAGAALIPGHMWDASSVQFSPRPLDVIELATEAGVHPAVVAGRVRFERGDYRLLSQLVGSGEVRGLFEVA